MNDRAFFKKFYFILQYLTLCNINYQLNHNGLAVSKSKNQDFSCSLLTVEIFKCTNNTVCIVRYRQK
mgnify:CR=1 FL=1